MDEDLILASINKLRQLTRVEARDRWRFFEGELPIAEATDSSNWPDWQTVTLNDRAHVAWSKGKRVLWLGQTFRVPTVLHEYPLAGLTLRLVLRWWAEDAQIFVDGNLVHRGDLFDCWTRVLLRETAEPGEEIAVTLRLVSPGHDDGALVTSHFLFENPESPQLDPGFVADELEIIYRQIETLETSKREKLIQLISDLEAIPLSALKFDKDTFDRSLFSLHQTLATDFSQVRSKIYLLGHAHLDMAWLWPVRETWEAAQNTFASALNLQAEFPHLIFSHSTPALYHWIETHRPDLFTQIQAGVKQENWEVAAGLWVEPELNIISGESIVRQVLYGQRYTEEKFDRPSPVAWLPDSFGFCWQLPQILKQGEIQYFVTQKLRWNDTTKFPDELFNWKSPDGSEILSLMSAPIGQDIDPVQMATYAFEFQQKTGLDRSLWLPGVGDHGGGPTRDMLETVERWQQSGILGEMAFISAADYLKAIEAEINADGAKSLPVWNDELYLEYHRGCYTTHADQKRSNRRCEQLLYQAELFSSLATLAAGVSYPQRALETAWKQVLFNQFHDILPGSAIPEVYVDADREWRAAKQTSSQLLESALQTLATCMRLPPAPQPDAKPIFIFNPLNWQRSQVVEIAGNDSDLSSQVFDGEGNPVPTQLAFDSQILFLAESVPGVGCRLFWLGEKVAETGISPSEEELTGYNIPQNISSIPEKEKTVKTNRLDAESWVLENQFLRVTVDSQTGNLTSIFDKLDRFEVLASDGGNQLQAFADRGQYWDAWNIDPNYNQHPLPEPSLHQIEWVERGKLRSRLRVVRLLNRSRFCQDYILDCHSRVLKIETTVDWYERHVLVKAAFHFNFEAEVATSEMPCGAIARPTRPQTPADRAKWEVPHLHWIDLTGENLASNLTSNATKYGVSLLNDCKYGSDAKCDRLRLTLLRGATWPDPQADLGTHHFTYAIYPHAGSWQEAQTVRSGYELNFPLLVRDFSTSQVSGKIDSQFKFMQSSSMVQFLNVSARNFILMALKRSEDNSEKWILRGYECAGEATNLELGGAMGLEIEAVVNLLERSSRDLSQFDRETKTVSIAPWKIVSLMLERYRNR
ncbi:MAG: alpha-mannosidase [Cyanobacteriota bacterium]|nr:alpha-mannosidase [Cyanobacteriota bacterium]